MMKNMQREKLTQKLSYTEATKGLRMLLEQGYVLCEKPFWLLPLSFV